MPVSPLETPILPVQASPNDTEAFPFVVLGNKIDQDDGKSRTVSVLHSTVSFLSVHSGDLVPIFGEGRLVTP